MDRDAALAAVFEPVRPTTTFEETVGRLGTAIRIGLLRPGSRLPAERNLAHQFRISRSTLRDALATLTQTGHLVSVRGCSGGTFVAERPPLAAGEGKLLSKDVRAVLDDRVAIETGATLLAAERAKPDDIGKLAEVVRWMAEVECFEDYRRADIRLHIGIAEAARSPRLVRAMTEVQGRMSDLIALVPLSKRALAHSNAQHEYLMKVLRRGAARPAVKQMREHIRCTEHILAGLI